MRLDRLITLNVVQPWRRLFSGTEAPKHRNTETPVLQLPILMYHNITDAPEPGVAPYYKVNTSPAVFASHMQFLADNGYKTITISELVSSLKAHRPTETQVHRNTETLPLDSQLSTSSETPKHGSTVLGRSTSQLLNTSTPKLVALTFDDGFSSVYTDAYPILKKHGFTATVYLATAFIGDTPHPFSPTGSPKHREVPRLRETTETPKHRNTGSPSPRAPVPQFPSSPVCLTWSQCREMATNGIEFGSHTVTHPKLVSMSWNEIRAELAESKRTIEERLHTRCTQFCYPYAFPQANSNFCGRLKNTLRELGYESCATTQVGRVAHSDDPFQLKRIPANSMDDSELLHAKLSGSYDWIARPQALIKQAKAWRANGTH